MKKTLLLVIFICGVAAAKAQQNTIINPPPPGVSIKDEDSTKVFTSAEVEPTPHGGIQAFYKYLVKNVHYPEDAKRKNLQGRVFLIFVVERDGSITDIKVLRGVSSDIDAEAVRVMSNSSKWNPALQNGRPVKVQYIVPIGFVL